MLYRPLRSRVFLFILCVFMQMSANDSSPLYLLNDNYFGKCWPCQNPTINDSNLAHAHTTTHQHCTKTTWHEICRAYQMNNDQNRAEIVEARHPKPVQTVWCNKKHRHFEYIWFAKCAHRMQIDASIIYFAKWWCRFWCNFFFDGMYLCDSLQISLDLT